MSLRARQNGGGKIRNGGGRGAGNGSPGGRGNAGATPDTWQPSPIGADWALSNGNLTATGSGQNGNWVVTANTGKGAGKVYWEILVVAKNSTFDYTGLVISTKGTGNTGVQGASFEMLWKADGNWSVAGGTAPAAFATNDVLGFAFDFSTGKIRAFKNNVEQGLSPAFSATTPYKIGCTNTFGSSPNTFTLRTSAASQSYSPPAGYVAWDDA